MGAVPSIADQIAVGVDTATESAGDKRLAFEIAREDISIVSYDFVNDKLIFKSPMPNVAMTVEEICLIAQQNGPQNYGRLLSTFDSATEDWTGATWLAANNVRIGVDALNHTPSASGSTTSTGSLVMDLSDMR